MDRLTARKVRYFIGLHYPLFVTVTDEGFRGSYPDLPGCVGVADSPTILYATMDQLRRDWIATRLFGGEEVPLPNAHLRAQVTVTATTCPELADTDLVQTSWTSVQALA